MIDHCLIISRYMENIDWVYTLLSVCNWIENVLIFNKGLHVTSRDERVKIIPRPNIGREGETYLHYIIENYDTLPSKLWFIQANPFEHSPNFMNLCSKESCDQYVHKIFQPLSWRYNSMIPPNCEFDERYYIHNNKVNQYYIDSKTQQTTELHTFYDYLHEMKVHKLNKLIRAPYNNYLQYMCCASNIPEPQTIIPYCWSAIFFVRREGILKNPKNTYTSLKQILLSSDPHGGDQGFVLERLWQYIFTHESWENVEHIHTSLYHSEAWSCTNVCACYDQMSSTISVSERSYCYHPSKQTPAKKTSHNVIQKHRFKRICCYESYVL